MVADMEVDKVVDMVVTEVADIMVNVVGKDKDLQALQWSPGANSPPPAPTLTLLHDTCTLLASNSLHSNSPHWLHENVAALQEFIFGIHPDVRIKMRYSHTFICFPSLWLGKELNQLHLEVGKYWNCHHSVVFFQYVFPQWCSLFFSFPHR